MSRFTPPGLGWVPDVPDPRDFTVNHPVAISMLGDLASRRKRRRPRRVDLRQDADGVYFLPPDNQGTLNCSPVFAVLGLVEYFERRALGRTFDASTMFVYHAALRMRQLQGDPGVDMRTTLKSLKRFGSPPARFWPYDPAFFCAGTNDVTLMGFTRELADLVYIRLDPPGVRGRKVLKAARSFLASRLPLVFGFPVPASLTMDADIPFRPEFDAVRGGQAVVAVGYDDERYAAAGGALLVRSSWGSSWGAEGCGWLPYTYIRHGLVRDVWTVLRSEWLDSGEFFRPSVVDKLRITAIPSTSPAHP